MNVLNEGVFTVVFGLFAGKSYSIFALLFGFTFYIQYSNQQAKGKDFGYLFNPDYQLPNLGVGAMYAEMAEHTKRGDLWNFIWQNVTLGQKASLLWAVGAGRYVQTCGLFMLGMLIGRRKLFISSEENSRFWIKTLIITAIVFGPLYQLKVLLMDTADSAIVRQTAGVVLDMWQKFAFMFVLVASFVLLMGGL